MRELRYFLGYIITGSIATVIDLGFLVLFIDVMGIWYVFSVAFAYSISAVIHYLMSKYLNFRNKSKKVFVQLGLFFIFACIGLLINVAVVFFMVEFLKIWYLYAKLIAVTLAFLFSYTLNRRITFGMLQ